MRKSVCHILPTLWVVITLVGCTTCTTNDATPWLRLRSAEPTTIVPHLCYVGDSYTVIQRNDQGSDGKWVDVIRQNRGSVRLYAYPNEAFAIAVENQWGGGKNDILILRRGFPAIGIKTLSEFDLALPGPGGGPVVFTMGESHTVSVTTYDPNGDVLFSETFSLKNSPEWGRGFIGFCGQKYLFEDIDQKLWIVVQGALVELKGNPTPVCKIPKCTGYGGSCLWDDEMAQHITSFKNRRFAGM